MDKKEKTWSTYGREVKAAVRCNVDGDAGIAYAGGGLIDVENVVTTLEVVLFV